MSACSDWVCACATGTWLGSVTCRPSPPQHYPARHRHLVGRTRAGHHESAIPRPLLTNLGTFLPGYRQKSFPCLFGPVWHVLLDPIFPLGLLCVCGVFCICSLFFSLWRSFSQSPHGHTTVHALYRLSPHDSGLVRSGRLCPQFCSSSFVDLGILESVPCASSVPSILDRARLPSF